MTIPHRKKNHRATIGFLSGWQIYERTMLEDYYGELALGITRTAHERHCNLLLSCGMSPSDFPIVVRPAFPIHDPTVDYLPVGEWNTDGLILAHPLIGKPVLEYVAKLRASGFPLITIGGAEAFSSVQIDNPSGIWQAMTHLLEHGHESIAFIGGHAEDVEGDSGQRLWAYQDFVRQHGLNDNPALIEMGDYAFDGGTQAIQKIMQSGAPFTAIVTSGDESALGAIHALRQAGLSVPEDVAVIGFDDSASAVLSQPPLTTIGFSAFELGRQAAELLLRQIQAPDHPPASVKVKPRLVIRQSCGCQAGREWSVETPPVEAHASLLDSHALADEMTRAVLPFALYLKEDEVLGLCDRLAIAFVRAVQASHPAPFRVALDDVLRFAASINDDAYAWRWAIIRLYELTHDTKRSAAQTRFVELLISEARETIAEAIQRQHREYLENQRLRADQMGLLSSRLLTALNEQQVYDILAESLPEMGIHHLALAFFRTDMNGLPESSDFQVVLGEKKHSLRNQPQEFPPKGVYRADQPFALALLPLGGEAQLSGYAVFDTEHLESYGAITQQIKVALRLARLYQGALDGLKAAEEAGQMKSRFLSTVSHELQTPLRIIVTDSERLLHDGHFRSPSLQRIHGSARHLDALIRDVLDLTRDDIGQLKLTREPLDLNQTLQPVLEIGKQLTAEKGLSWTLQTPPSLPAVWGDSARLRQIVLNLLTNAVKFTSAGGVMVMLSARVGDVLVSVRDTGAGVPLEEQKMIFGEFYQSSRTQEQRFAGMGIGLALCKRLVDMHGGEIGVRSDSQRGSEFFFSVPILGAVESLPVEQSQGLGVESAPLAESSILLVDDEPMLLEMHAQLIREQIPFAKVATAENGEDALERMRHQPPDLVMLDLGMPGMDGFRVLETMQKQETTRSIPVIILTGQSLSEADMARLRGRVEAVLNKGLLRTDEVLAQLRKALSRSQGGLSGDMRALMRKSIAYIQEHYDEPLSRENVARYVGVSAGYFSRSFHKEAGISFQEYLNRYRIHRARTLLAEGRINVTDVAFSVGFQNVSYFCQVFRQVVGVSPRVYQKANG
jgi:DNA-binding LacI/PurR family transcriptional regulator/signal transduction histidine kinase/AraC-like DNA-binding protein